MDLADRILQIIEVSPGIKAKEVAARLGTDRATVNSLLYGALRHRTTQDSSYRWWPKGKSNTQLTTDQVQVHLDTPLAKLCRYYLDCLNHDDQGGLSVFASGKFDLDYLEIDSETLLSGDSKNIFNSDRALKLLRKVRRDRGRLVVVLGYPVQLTFLRSRTGSWEGFKVGQSCSLDLTIRSTGLRCPL